MKKEIEVLSDGSLMKKESLILFCIFLILGIVFFVSLSIVNPPVSYGTGNVVSPEGAEVNFDFGIGEIIYSVIFATLMTSFLLWNKSLMKNNAYLGVGIGLVCLSVVSYAFYLRYWGINSKIFLGVFLVVNIFYLSKNFMKFRKFDRYDEKEFDES